MTKQLAIHFIYNTKEPQKTETYGQENEINFTNNPQSRYQSQERRKNSVNKIKLNFLTIANCKKKE